MEFTTEQLVRMSIENPNRVILTLDEYKKLWNNGINAKLDTRKECLIDASKKEYDDYLATLNDEGIFKILNEKLESGENTLTIVSGKKQKGKSNLAILVAYLMNRFKLKISEFVFFKLSELFTSVKNNFWRFNVLDESERELSPATTMEYQIIRKTLLDTYDSYGFTKNHLIIVQPRMRILKDISEDIDYRFHMTRRSYFRVYEGYTMINKTKIRFGDKRTELHILPMTIDMWREYYTIKLNKINPEINDNILQLKLMGH